MERFAVSGKATFTDNHSIGGCGGALCAHYNNNLSFSRNSNCFRKTAADFGGALNANKNNTLSFSGNNIFDGNTAELGGVLFAYNNSYHFELQ